MKKSILLTLFIVLGIILLTLTGCGEKKEDATQNTKNVQTSEEATNKQAEQNISDIEYEAGVLVPFMNADGEQRQTDFIIDGIILIGNRHDYSDRDDTMEYIEYFAKQGYKKEKINSSFYLGEWIQFYIDTKYTGNTNDVKILVTPHKTISSYENMTYRELINLANENGFVLDYKTPEADNYKFVGENFVHQDYPEGKYDIVFTYKEVPAYLINIDLSSEPME